MTIGKNNTEIVTGHDEKGSGEGQQYQSHLIPRDWITCTGHPGWLDEILNPSAGSQPLWSAGCAE